MILMLTGDDRTPLNLSLLFLFAKNGTYTVGQVSFAIVYPFSVTVPHLTLIVFKMVPCSVSAQKQQSK